jgi:hypothetical protein
MDIYAARDVVMPSLRRFILILACAVAGEATTNWNLVSASMSTALTSFDGGKFMFSHAPGLYVCEKNVQQQAAAEKNLLLSAPIIQMLLGSIDDACVRAFGVLTTDFDLPTVHRSTPFTPYGQCLVYLFSPSAVYCVSRTDGRVTELDLPATIGQGFALSDVTVHNRSLVVTFARQALMSSVVFRLDGAFKPATLAGVAGLLMFAQGRPEFCLTLSSSDSSVKLTQLDCGGRALPDLMCLPNDVKKLFSRRVMLSSRNTFLDGSGSLNFVVFATAVYASGSDGRLSVFVYVSSLDLLRFTVSDLSMPHRVYRLTQTQGPALYAELFEDIETLGEAVLSAAWWNATTLALAVAVELDGTLLQFPKFAVTVDSLAVSGAELSDVLYAVQAPFVQLDGALFSAGRLHTCLSCRATSDGRAASGFFAFGASPIQFRRLLPCAVPDTYVDDSTWGSTPVQTCAALANTVQLPSLVPVFVMSLRCEPLTVELEIVLTLAAGAALRFNMPTPYVAASRRRVLLQVRCKTGTAMLYDEYLYASGFTVRLSYGIVELSGGVDIESVRSVARSGVWRRRMALTSRADSMETRPGVLAAGSWQPRALVVQNIRAGQPIFVHVRREMSLAKLQLDMSIGMEAVTKVAFDVLSVTPVLSETAARALNGLFTVVYVPSAANLSSLSLAALTSGDDHVNWQRVHAAVRLSTSDGSLGSCEYTARLVAVNDSLWPIADLLPSGCDLALPQYSGQAFLEVLCHIELPLKLANNGSFVGLEVRALACALPETLALSVEMVPFMPMSECPAFFFLHALSRSCVACATERCKPGFHVAGCAELMHPARPVDCVACRAPADSRFPNTSSGCDAWVCRDNFFLANETACTPCTSSLNCTGSAGSRRAPCSRTENEKCEPCDAILLPRYAQWANSSKECVWRCSDEYFLSNGGCERCHSLADLRLLLDGEGFRAAQKFYRFRQCTASQQAAYAPCSESDFSNRLNGTYQSDAAEFATDCPLKCTEHDRLHLVKLALSDAAGASWAAQKCIECPLWPTFANGSRLPLQAFEMSAACEPSCSESNGYVAANNTFVCLWCPRAACLFGSYLSRADNCTRCRRCESRIPGANFTSNGRLDEPGSCAEACPLGHFMDGNTCRQHSTPACVDGQDYRIAGSANADAQCGACAVCTRARETRPCNATANRECESCGFLEDWNSEWSPTGCELLCKTGYTKLVTPTGQLCKKCWPCPRGSELPETPSTCACIACSKALPQGAFYTVGCDSECPLYHTVQGGACKYALQHASNAVSRAVQVSSVVCQNGRRIVQGAGQDSYRLFSCEDCDVPAGLIATDVNATWVWGPGCVWKCTGSLMKYDRNGTYGCAPYFVRRTSAPPAISLDWSASDLAALFGSLVVLLLFSLCLLRKFLAPKGESDDEEPVTADVQEQVKRGEV